MKRTLLTQHNIPRNGLFLCVNQSHYKAQRGTTKRSLALPPNLTISPKCSRLSTKVPSSRLPKMLWLPIQPLQLANNSITLLGITHSTPKRQNIKTHRFHTNPPLWHSSFSNYPKLIYSLVMLSTQRKLHYRRDLNSSNTLPSKGGSNQNGQHMIKGPYFKLPLIGGDPT